MEEFKKEMERERAEIARLKSLQHLRLKKLEEEKRVMQEKWKSEEAKYKATIAELQGKGQQDLGTKQLEKSSKKPCSKDPILIADHSREEMNGYSAVEEQLYQQLTQKTTSSDRGEPIFERYLNSQSGGDTPDANLEDHTQQFYKFADPLAPPELLHTLTLKPQDHDQGVKERSVPNVRENRKTTVIHPAKEGVCVDSKQIVENILKGYFDSVRGEETIGYNPGYATDTVTPEPSKDPIPESSRKNRGFASKYEDMLTRHKKHEQESARRMEKGTPLRDQTQERINRSPLNKGGLSAALPVTDTSYEFYFIVKEGDDEKVREVKKQRQTHLDLLSRSAQLECKFAERLAGFEERLRARFGANIDDSVGVRQLLKELAELWEKSDISFDDRIRFLSDLEKTSLTISQICKRMEEEIDYVSIVLTETSAILSALNQRELLKKTLMSTQEFDYKRMKPLLFDLKGIAEELARLLNNYQRTHKKKFYHRIGIDLMEVS
jgi:hypothetical protein